MMMVSRELSAMRESETVLRESGDEVILSSGSVEICSVRVGVTECITVELCTVASTECVREEEEASIVVVVAGKV